MRRLLSLLYDNRILAYLLPVFAVAAVTAPLVLVREQMETATVALLFFLPVGACAALSGLGPGIVSAIISFFSLNYFFISPYGTLLIHQTQDLVALLIFLILAISISQLVGRMMRSLATTRAREEETLRLYELSQSLSGIKKESEVIEKLARHVLETYKVDQEEVWVNLERHTYNLRLPGDRSPVFDLKTEPTLIMPLQGSHHLQGQIRLWRIRKGFKPGEVNLLRLYAQQAVLSLERIILDEQVRESELVKATEKLQSSLLNSISHDLRTPLVSITGALSSLREKSLLLDQDAREDLLDTAIVESERLNRLVGNLLNMTRLESGALRIHKEPCDLQDVIGSAIEQLGERVANRMILINIPQETRLIPLDMGLFEQVLVNVLDNAVKYSLPDTVIEINVREEGSLSLVEISDRGEGIPREDLERVFDKFFRVHRPHKVGGSGLGLAICKGIVDAHGGTIKAINREGGGTTIAISLALEGEA